ncbi:MAG TPA: DUF58 domain-containing protein [Bryobacteraceae bacterium]|nr:DUF58 domain-containing protein [Bryobacteraceae bacterium]
MRSFWNNLRRALEDGMRQHVTKLGFLFTITILLVGIAAFISANNLLFLLLASLLSTFLISGFISRLGLANLELDIEHPEHIAAGRPIIGHIIIKNAKRWMPSFSIHLSGAPESGVARDLYIPMLPAGSTLQVSVELLFSRRGLYRDNAFYFESRFPFGFTHRRAQVRLEREILVYPRVDPQGQAQDFLAEIVGEIESRQRGRGNDFYRIRPYEILESARHVDWKSTAHTGSLQVREFAREQDQSVTLFLDLDTTGAPPEWFENAIGFCAFLCWSLTLQNTPVRMQTQQFDCLVPNEATAYTILRYLALVTPVAGVQPSPPDADSSFSVILTPQASRLIEAGWKPDRSFGPDDLDCSRTAGGSGS